MHATGRAFGKAANLSEMFGVTCRRYTLLQKSIENSKKHTESLPDNRVRSSSDFSENRSVREAHF
jgi:hypothetical protein